MDMIDYSYDEAFSANIGRRYGKEIQMLYEDHADKLRREARETSHIVTQEEKQAGAKLGRSIAQEISRDGGSGDVPPSVAQAYKDFAETQQKQDSTFCIPGYTCGVQLNPDDSVTLVNCTNISTDMACQVASIILALDNLLDLTEPLSNPYDNPMGYGQNAAAYASMQRKQSIPEQVGAQFRRLRSR